MNVETKAGLIITVSVFLLFFGGCMASCASIDEATVTVKRLERDNQGQASSRYLVFTEEGETFQVANSWALMRFSGSDLYGRLDVGKRYDCEVHWFRIPLIGSYRNILEAEEATK